VFTGDNGANTDTGGSAYPLRGMKATAFEGGSRGVAFVSGAGLAPQVVGTVSQELMSLVDWLPTIVGGIAGVNLTEVAQVPKFPVGTAGRPCVVQPAVCSSACAAYGTAGALNGNTTCTPLPTLAAC
jgi:arylsulfatase A-like enzyme